MENRPDRETESPRNEAADHQTAPKARSPAPAAGSSRQKLTVQMKTALAVKPYPEQVQLLSPPGFLQFREGAERQAAPGEKESGVHAVAEHGVRGNGAPLPYLERIQKSFGRHDVTGVEAHSGGQASQAARELGAQAYATGDQVAFREAPSLHTAAHEAAHVVQQRAGVHLKDDAGRTGDEYERHADAVADAVVMGGSAEPVLDRFASSQEQTASHGVQMEEGQEAIPVPAAATESGGQLKFEPRSWKVPFEKELNLRAKFIEFKKVALEATITLGPKAAATPAPAGAAQQKDKPSVGGEGGFDVKAGLASGTGNMLEKDKRSSMDASLKLEAEKKCDKAVQGFFDSFKVIGEMGPGKAKAGASGTSKLGGGDFTVGGEMGSAGYGEQATYEHAVGKDSKVGGGVKSGSEGGSVGLTASTKTGKVNWKFGLDLFKLDKDGKPTILEASVCQEVPDLWEEDMDVGGGQTMSLKISTKLTLTLGANTDYILGKVAKKAAEEGVKRFAGKGLGFVEMGLIGGAWETIKGLGLFYMELGEDEAYIAKMNGHADAFCNGVLFGMGVPGAGGGEAFAAGQKIGEARRRQAAEYFKKDEWAKGLTDEEVQNMVATEFMTRADELKQAVYATYRPAFCERAYQAWVTRAQAKESQASMNQRKVAVRIGLGLSPTEEGPDSVEMPDASSAGQVADFKRVHQPRMTEEEQMRRQAVADLLVSTESSRAEASRKGQQIDRLLKQDPSSQEARNLGGLGWVEYNTKAMVLFSQAKGMPMTDLNAVARKEGALVAARDSFLDATRYFDRAIEAWNFNTGRKDTP